MNASKLANYTDVKARELWTTLYLWDSIDLDFMNLNQSAHGDREHGFIASRMNVKRKVIVGHWENPEVRERVA